MATARIANIIVDTLASIGVKRVYGVPGDSLNGITDAIRTHKSVAWIHTRNEEAAAFAAGAEAHLTGDLAVCAGSCGPGNTHPSWLFAYYSVMMHWWFPRQTPWTVVMPD